MRRILLVTVALALASCAPGLGRTLKVDYIEVPALSSSVKDDFSEARYRMGTVTDSRKRAAIGEIDGRMLEPEGDVAAAVRQAVGDCLREAGASAALFGGPVVSADVLAWRVDVTPGFPLSTADATASLRLRVERAGGRSAYSAQYSGGVQYKHPFLSSSDVEKALGDAVVTAVKEALKDEGFVAELGAR